MSSPVVLTLLVDSTNLLLLKGVDPTLICPNISVPGPIGKQGNSGTITLGTVETGNAGTNVEITNTGTPSNAIFNFKIPRGDTGSVGRLEYNIFVAIEGQTEFTVDFTLNDKFLVLIDNVPQSKLLFTRNDNTLVCAFGLNLGQILEIYD